MYQGAGTKADGGLEGRIGQSQKGGDWEDGEAVTERAGEKKRVWLEKT